MRTPEIQAIVARLPDLVNADDALVRRGARLSTSFLLAVDDAGFLILPVLDEIRRSTGV